MYSLRGLTRCAWHQPEAQTNVNVRRDLIQAWSFQLKVGRGRINEMGDI